jgi:CRP-like cAMP-binding protein
VIERGSAKVTLKGTELATLGDGDFLGEMSLIDQGPRSATVTPDTDSQLWFISPEDFNNLLDDVPFVARQILKVLANRLRALEGAPQYQWNRWWRPESTGRSLKEASRSLQESPIPRAHPGE